MKPIFLYISRYFYETDKRFIGFVTLFTSLLIFLNYYYNLDDRISNQPFYNRFLGRYAIYLAAFSVPYLAGAWLMNKIYFRYKPFLILLFISPAIFSVKAGAIISLPLAGDAFMNDYWNQIVYWPLLLLMVAAILFITWIISGRGQPFYGTRSVHMNWKPYWLMLLAMLPLIAAASASPDFLAVYPKLHTFFGTWTAGQPEWWHKLLFELSYGTDFIGIELFFRGFLVLAFLKWAGRDAILPMACFYCCIHFGKPLGECISSYFGGLLLGIIVANTRSIWGGLLVHLGIAWLMELGGYIGRLYQAG